MSTTRFEDQERTVPVEDVRVGDFVVTVPSHNGVQGAVINSGVTSSEADFDTWRRRTSPRRYESVEGRRMTFISLREVVVRVPNGHPVVVRRRVEEG